MLQKMLLPVSVAFVLCLMAARPARASAGVVMNYGADGNDYFQFTTPPWLLTRLQVLRP
jgi:hypothetical protein